MYLQPCSAEIDPEQFTMNRWRSPTGDLTTLISRTSWRMSAGIFGPPLRRRELQRQALGNQRDASG
jgi:hypothetical protein